MIKINFRGKEMSLLEAKVLRIGLKTGVIKLELKEEEKKAYTNRKELQESFSKFLKKEINFSENDYFINELNIAIQGGKLAYCKKYGHKESYPYSNTGAVVYSICSRCKRSYQRGLTNKEAGDFDKVMRTPMTI